jgi:hypothetical protein
VTELAHALWKQPPVALKALTATQALALATELFAKELFPGAYEPDDTPALADLARRAVTSVARGHGESYDELRQRAAFVAVRQLGGAHKVGIPAWMEKALGDSDNWTVCEHIIDYVTLACHNTAPGRRWCYVFQLGFVTYQPS